MNKKVIFIFVATVFLSSGFLLLKRSNNEPASVVQNDPFVIDETLQDVVFCGKTYQSRQVYIQGVNIIKRIAEVENFKADR